MNHVTRTFALFALIGAMVTAARAAYDLSWWTVDGGSANMSGGTFTLNGTAGQPDTTQMTGGVYTLTGGFWTGTLPTRNASANWTLYK